MTELETIEEAIAYRKANKYFFRKFLFHYKIANNKLVKALEIICGILLLVVVVLVGLHLFSIITLEKLHWKIVGITFLTSFFLIGFLSSFEIKQDEMYEDYPVSEMMTQMYELTKGLNYYFWKTGRLKKIRKMLKKNQATGIIDAAKQLKPKYDNKKLLFCVEDYNVIAENAIDRQNRRIESRNKKMQKEQAKLERKAMAFEVFSDLLLSGGSESIPETTNSYTPIQGAPEHDYKAEADAKYQADLASKKAQFAKDATYWENEYYRLVKNDPQCLQLATQKAQYNMNYFRRRSKDG